MLPRIAPTERCAEQDAWPCKRPDAAPLRGVVHDPTARRMGGIAGHAGLFSTARDLQRFARMLLARGELGDARVMSAATVTSDDLAGRRRPAWPAVRGLGWDIDTSFSSNRGDLFPIGSFGHTGFTGTSLWIDPSSGVVRDLPLEPSASGRRWRRRRAAQPHRHGRRRGDFTVRLASDSVERKLPCVNPRRRTVVTNAPSNPC